MIKATYLLAGLAFLFFTTACHSNGNNNSSDDSTVVKMDIKVSDQTAKEMDSFLNAYYVVKNALVDDDSIAAVAAATPLLESVNRISPDAISDADQRKKTQTEIEGLQIEISGLQKDSTLADIRTAFETISNSAYRLIKVAGLKDVTVYRTHCPMAFDDKGADWLSGSSQILNPYFGHRMINCGMVKETLEF